MYDACFIIAMQSLGDLRTQLDGFLDVRRVRFNPLIEARPFDKVTGNVDPAVLAAHFVNGDNHRVPHLSGGTGFTEELLCVVPASLKLYSNTVGIRRSSKPVWGVESFRCVENR